MVNLPTYEFEMFVKAVWDEEEELYFSESNIPGLFIEAKSLGDFEEVLFDVAPELILENVVKPHLANARGKPVAYEDLPDSFPFLWEGAAPRQVNLAVA